MQQNYSTQSNLKRIPRDQDYKSDYTNDSLMNINGQIFTRESLVNFKLHELKEMFSETNFSRVKKARRQAQIKQAVTLWRMRRLRDYLLKEKRKLENEIEELQMGCMLL